VKSFAWEEVPQVTLPLNPSQEREPFLGRKPSSNAIAQRTHFGLGIVFSDKTMDGFRSVDEQTHAEITRALPPLGRYCMFSLKAPRSPLVWPWLLRDRPYQFASDPAAAHSVT